MDKIAEQLKDIIAEQEQAVARGRIGEGNNTTALHLAVREGSPENVRLLCEYKADPDAPNKQGRSPLHLAVLRGRRDIIQTLLQYHANPYLKDRQGLTPLDLAQGKPIESVFRSKGSKK